MGWASKDRESSAAVGLTKPGLHGGAADRSSSDVDPWYEKRKREFDPAFILLYSLGKLWRGNPSDLFTLPWSGEHL